MSSKFHGTGKGIGRSGASAVTSYLHGYNVGPGSYKAAGELIAKEAQKKIDERHAKAGKVDKRKTNSRYSDAFVAMALDMLKTQPVAVVADKLKIRPATLINWRDGMTRAPSSAAAVKRMK